MTEYWLADRIMSSQPVRDAGLSWDQVVAVLRGMADYELWKKAGLTRTPTLVASRFCHAIADDIQDRLYDTIEEDRWPLTNWMPR